MNEWPSRELYKDGAVIPFGDTGINILRFPAEKKGRVTVRYENKSVIPSLKIYSDIEEDREAIVAWFRECARRVLSAKAEYYRQRMQVTYGRIAIKEQKTRWGSCSSKGNLNFNWKVILMPEAMQDYIVVHELSHLKQMNHSRYFWQEVEKVLPDYKVRVQWQKQHEAELFKY